MTVLKFNLVLQDIKKLAAVIRQFGFVPDYIVGVTRGGWIPARLLSNELEVRKLLSVGLNYTNNERTRLDAYQLPDPMPYEKKLLIVEDCLESGYSLARAAELFQETKNFIKTASLYTTAKTTYKPDFSIREYDHPPRFPWE